MDSALAVANMNNQNSEMEDEFDSYTDYKVCVYETAISGEYIKQEPHDTEDELGNINNYDDIKDDKACIYETVINGGCVKQEPCDTKDEPENVHNDVNIKEEIIKSETGLTPNVKGNYLTCCEECGEEYDLYCFKCPMLIRIFNSNNPDLDDNSNKRTLPKNFVDMFETQSGVGIVALRVVPKGVVFGPFEGLDAVSQWKLKKKELAYAKDPKCLNWMQYIRRVDRNSHPNLTPFQYEDGLYYRSDCHISVGDELLVCCDSDKEESMTQDSYFKPRICESLDGAYACTLCCVGYKSIRHLEAHNSRCPRKRNQNDFCKEVIQCCFCKIYVDKKEYLDYHVDRCFENNTKISAMHQDDKPFRCTQCTFKTKTKKRLKQHIAIHSDVRPFACSFCSFKATTSARLKAHMVVHDDNKPFACSHCSYETKTKSNLKQHIATHTDDKPFGCKQCPFKTKTNHQLKLHIASHSDDKPFACSFCSFKAAKSARLKAHMVIHKDDNPFACSLCSYVTKTKSNLKHHMSIHNEHKPFACSLCSYKTKTNSLLKQHMVIHGDDKPFGCKQCPFKTKTNYQLKLHIARHSDDKAFACSFCSFKTTTNARLKAHVIVHNDSKTFTCSVCSYNAKTKCQLKEHMSIHDDDKSFACTVCSYKAKTNSKLKLHMATHNDVTVLHIKQEKSLIESKD